MTGQSFASYLSEDTRQLGLQEFEKCISSGLPRLQLKLKFIDKSGRPCPVVWSAITTRINNEINGCVGIIRKTASEI
jgi:hypothetical protein